MIDNEKEREDCPDCFSESLRVQWESKLGTGILRHLICNDCGCMFRRIYDERFNKVTTLEK